MGVNKSSLQGIACSVPQGSMLTVWFLLNKLSLNLKKNNKKTNTLFLAKEIKIEILLLTE